MAVFFFVVGLEIKRELVEGELSDRAKATLPAIAAIGGMAAPAAIYLAWNIGAPAARGWGIPMATDIAFAIGVLALLGSRVPVSLKVLLLSIAIADDIGAILVIAAFYTPTVNAAALASALVGLALVVALWRVPRWWSDPLLVAVMVFVWVATLASGVHATIAGVALGLITPAQGGAGPLPPAQRLERTLHPWTSYLVVPVFALANAGVALDGQALGAALVSPVAPGVVMGLVIGKPLGIVALSWLSVRLGIARLPAGVSWAQLIGLGAVAGIGFTVSLFIAELALADAALAQAKIGIMAGSLTAGTAGLLVLSRSLPPSGAPRGPT